MRVTAARVRASLCRPGCFLLIGCAAANAWAEPIATPETIVELDVARLQGQTLYFDLRTFVLVDPSTGPIRSVTIARQPSGPEVRAQVIGGCIQITMPRDTTIWESGPAVIPFTVNGVTTSSSGELQVGSGRSVQRPTLSCASTLPENAAPRLVSGQSHPIQLTGTQTLPLTSLVSDPDPNDQLTFTVTQSPAGSLDATSGPLRDLQYMAPPPNAQEQIQDTFTIQISDGVAHPYEQQLFLTFTLGLNQNWSADPNGVRVSGGAGCGASAAGVSCQVRTDASRLTIDLGSVVTPSAAATQFSYSITLEGTSADSSGLGTLMPSDNGTFTKSPDGSTTGQSVVTYDYSANFRNPVNLRYALSSGGFTEQGVISVTFNAAQTLEALVTTSNQRAIAGRIDFICPELRRQEETLTDGELQLLQQCEKLTNSDVTSPTEIPAAMDSIAAEEIAAQKRIAIDLTRDMNKALAFRIAALRGGNRGISITGLNLGIDGQQTMTSLLEPWLNEVLGGGASSDLDSPFARLGVFVQGQFNIGDKDDSDLESGFDFDSLGGMFGVDYRFRDDLIAGLSVSYYESNVDFTGGTSELDGSALGASIYGSFFPTSALYVDFVGGMAWSEYDQTRTVGYTFTSGDRYSTDLAGSSDGTQAFVGVSTGYEFRLGGISIIPNIKTYYLDGSIDAYDERARNTSAGSCAPDCSAWDIEIGKQLLKSFTLSGGVQVACAWSGKWGVLRPYLRTDLVREFEDDGQQVIARLLNDNQITGAIGSQTAPITITTEQADTDYIVWGSGVSLQLALGVASFFDYQRLEGYDGLTVASYTLGLRYEIRF
jgi:outer membrane lipase/esterase